MLSRLGSHIFPRRCLFCGSALNVRMGLCSLCRAQIKPVPAPTCEICGKPTGTKGVCLQCQHNHPPFDLMISAGVFEGLLKDLIHKFKYNKVTIYKKLLAHLISDIILQHDIQKDILTFVPLHWTRMVSRGYNHSALIAREVSGSVGMHLRYNVIKKVLSVMLDDLREAWKNVQPVSLKIVRSEVNPQFITVVPPNEPVAIMGFELEINGTAANVTLCYPYAALEPVRDKLAGVVQSEPSVKDSVWAEQFRYQLMEVPVEVVVELGKAIITGKDLLSLSVGDVIQLDTCSKEKLKVKVADSVKFAGYPGYYRGSQSLQIANVFERRY